MVNKIIALVLVIGVSCTQQYESATEPTAEESPFELLEPHTIPAVSETIRIQKPQAESDVSGDSGKKHALIVAIGDYPNPRVLGYPRIHADNDIALISSALENHGFDSIDTLVNGQASRDAILEALDRLVSSTQTGDVIVFHYSGHGDQITDDDGEELDGYDEVLVPFGAPAKNSFKTQAELDAYTGDRHIRDDELGTYVAVLRQKAGRTGNVVFILDSCFSGTGTRGVPDGPQARGVDEPIGAPATTRGASQTEEAGGLFERRIVGSRSGGVGADDEGLAPYIVFSGASHDEKNYETADKNQGGIIVGSLSLAMNRALAQIKPGDTYQLLFGEVKKFMAKQVPHQMPQVEGDRHVELFSGNIVDRVASYSVEQVIDAQKVALSGGSFTGLMSGARIAIFPRRIQSPQGASDGPWTTGTITTARPSVAVATLDNPAPDGIDLASGHAFVTDPAFEELGVKVKISARLPDGVRAELSQLLGDLPVVDAVTTGEDLVIDDRPGSLYKSAIGGKNIYVLTPADSVPVLSAIPFDELDEAKGELGSGLLNFARNQFIKSLTLRSADISAKLDVVPGTHMLDDLGITGTDTTRYAAVDKGGSWQFPAFEPNEFAIEIDGYLLRITNTGKKGAYVSVLDLTPNGCISPLLPLDGYYTREETYIPAGQSYLFTELALIAEPRYGYGIETLKLFATSEEIDLSPLVTTCDEVSWAGTRAGGDNLSGLAQILADADSGTRSPVPKSRGFGSTDTVIFRVIKPD